MSHKVIALITLFALFSASPGFAQTRPLRVENFVRIKGQESTTIRAFGIVSGLPGTGDDPKAYTPTARAILRQLSRSGMFVGSDEKGINTTKNNALVEVIATIPRHGARDGDVIDCMVVSHGNAKSLAGGVLSPTAMGTSLQQDENSVVLGMAQGSITIEQTSTPTVGRITGGCRLHADFTNPYVKDGLVTLVLNEEVARPSMALKIAETINNDPDIRFLSLQPARAINSNYVVVRMPTSEYIEPLDFIAKIMDAEMIDPPVAVPRVTINDRTGIIAVDQNVEVRPTAVTYQGYVVEITPELQPGELEQFPRQFIGVDTDTKFRQMNGEAVNNVKLRSVMATFDALRATPQEMIEIIKILQKQGAIIGDVVFVD